MRPTEALPAANTIPVCLRSPSRIASTGCEPGLRGIVRRISRRCATAIGKLRPANGTTANPSTPSCHIRHWFRVPQLREYLVGLGKAEIGQHDNDLLLAGAVALITNDQRRGHQELLLEPLMRVHPERASKA